MIICLTHGSSKPEVNENQSKAIYDLVKNNYPNEEIIESYYSDIVIRRLEKKKIIINPIETILVRNYHKEAQFIVVLTTLIDGIERQRILNKIKLIDLDNKVKVVDPLLTEKNFPKLSTLFDQINNNILLIGHGNNTGENQEYHEFENYLNNPNKNLKFKLITLKEEYNLDDIKVALGENILIYPLMMIQAHHTKFDVENKLIPKLATRGIETELYNQPLIKNKIVHKIYLEEINEILYANK